MKCLCDACTWGVSGTVPVTCEFRPRRTATFAPVVVVTMPEPLDLDLDLGPEFTPVNRADRRRLASGRPLVRR